MHSEMKVTNPQRLKIMFVKAAYSQLVFITVTP